MNYNHPESQTHLTQEQFMEYYEAQKYKPKYDVWKTKYQINEALFDIRKDVHAAPNVQEDEPITGDVKVLIGPNAPTYPNSLQLHLEKKHKE